MLVFVSTPVSAEVEKTALMCKSSICFYWWPKLPELTGWHHDHDGSYQINANVLVPDGKTFADAAAVIYVEAIYKPRVPELTSVDALIASDKTQFLEGKPGTLINDSPGLITGDGKTLKSFTFFPSKQGDWERVSFGEEGDFYLIFTVSSRSEQAYRDAEPVYEKLVGQYREKL
ncbi:hypothetical protein ACXU4B_17720 [Dyella soli]|uniref:DUF1795 domain-containing protein n=1 Tax=Dyella soli TaxID=522319 RepID=A0A4R0YNX3_9GAMM|nr:hypothetical protein [Dyella soli]TCI06365.1 hypothetical protein EZM97_33300 [Dyella soli]